MPDTNHLHVITEDNFQEEVLESPVPVLVDFTATWCPPCRALIPVLDRLATTTAGRVKIGTVAAEESPALAARFSVRGYPTVIAFGGGRERARHLGATQVSTLLRMVEACVGT